MEILAVRQLDSLGRLVLPLEARRIGELELNSPIEIAVDEANQIILRKLALHCAVCGQDHELLVLGEKALCQECLAQFQNEANARLAAGKAEA